MNYFLLTLALLFSSIVYSAEETGTVDYIKMINSNGSVVFNIVMSNKPAADCGSGSQWSIKMDDSDISRMQYSAVLAALSSGKLITAKEHVPCQPAAYGRYVDSIRVLP